MFVSHSRQLTSIVNLLIKKQSFHRQYSTVILSSYLGGNGRKISTSSVNPGVNVRPMKITSKLAADQLVRDLNEKERDNLVRALRHLNEELELENVTPLEAPTAKQLRLVAFCNSVPFIGFGFLDNAIMIAAGEYIDTHLGITFGISTMAAAALGNMISDVAGIGLAGYVEVLAARVGIEEPKLKPAQVTMWQTRFSSHFGRAIGIVIGCIIGMFPLLFYKQKESEPPKPRHT